MAALGILGVLAAMLLFVLLFFVAVALFQWLWNITMPDVFGLRTVTFWQAFRLLLIAAILFGGDRVVEKTTSVGTETVSAFTGSVQSGVGSRALELPARK